MYQPIIRLWPSSEVFAREQAEMEGLKLAEWVNRLIRDYEAGLSFDHPNTQLTVRKRA